MSNLNINNLDVQRIINVLNELSRKIYICSFLTFKTMYNIEANKDILRQKIAKLDFWEDLDKHFNCMMEFRAHVIELEEEKKEEKNSEIKDEDKLEESDEAQSQLKEKEKTERKDLIGVTENFNSETKELSKSTRNICRKYYKEIELLQEMEMFRMDPEVIKFAKDFSSALLSNYINKSKMTKEEELSQVALNAHLTSKIIDLEHQIATKTLKLENLKRERQNYKSNCNNQLTEIDNEMKNLRIKTRSELDKLAQDINKDLNNDFDRHEKEIADLKSKLKEVTQEFEERKKKHEEVVEKEAIKNFDKEENELKNNIEGYDAEMRLHRDVVKNLKMEMQNETNKLNSLKIERDKSKYKDEAYQESFKKYEDKLKAKKYETDMKIYASEYIQSQFKGFFIRKTQRKKYVKILAPLKKVALPPPDQKDKKPKK